MARVKLSEYRAKKILVDNYLGYSLKFDSLTEDLAQIPEGKYVLKVDQGIKKRGKQGLVAVNITARCNPEYVNTWSQKGFNRFILEPLISARTRAGEIFFCTTKPRRFEHKL
jgi:succinyl-CoA synthetase beta subunit